MNLRKNYPQSRVQIAEPQTGNLDPAWRNFFAAMVAQPGPIDAVVVGASPFAYTASESGHLHVTGGTVSAITLTRAGTVLATGMTSGFIPVSLGDVVAVTYSVKPTLNFVPN